MVFFQDIDKKVFLNEYWQKKPLVIRQALPGFVNALSGDELAGLSLDDEIESRLVFETPGLAPFWQLKQGPFSVQDFASLPKTHWTLLVQGVDRIIPPVALLLDHFNFIPQWRVDDVMISYAVKHGSVGPHYDNYDVFLYQAVGSRKWLLTTQNCTPENYLSNVDLRIMDKFIVEEEHILQPGDMLYLPAHVGHHGMAVSDECMTYSFGYRSYQGQEMWESYADCLAEKVSTPKLYQDPNWVDNDSTALIPPQAWKNAQQLMQQILADEREVKNWFGCFITSLDQSAEQLLPQPLPDSETGDLATFIAELQVSEGLMRDACCRFAYQEEGELQLFVNGCLWDSVNITPGLLKLVANHRILSLAMLMPYIINRQEDQLFLYALWKLQWLQWIEA